MDALLQLPSLSIAKPGTVSVSVSLFPCLFLYVSLLCVFRQVPVALLQFNDIIVGVTRSDYDFVGGLADEELSPSGALVGPRYLGVVVERFQLDAVAAGGPH